MIRIRQNSKLPTFTGSLAYIFLLILLLPAIGATQKPPPFALPKPAELQKLKSGVIRTEKGDIYIELFPQDAPWHVANFKYLADKKYYDNTQFHIYKEGFILQGGKPRANGGRGPGYSIPPEFNPRKHIPGALGMARAVNAINPGRRSHGSQFHLLLTEDTRMDGTYTIFGRVVRGMDVLRKLRKGDAIRSITVYVRK